MCGRCVCVAVCGVSVCVWCECVCGECVCVWCECVCGRCVCMWPVCVYVHVALCQAQGYIIMTTGVVIVLQGETETTLAFYGT